MTSLPSRPVKRTGHQFQFISRRVMLYLRLLMLAETIVIDLTEKTMERLSASLKTNVPGRVMLAESLVILLVGLKENNIPADERYHVLFSSVSHPDPERTPMAYRACSGEDAPQQNKYLRSVLILRRVVFFGLVLLSTYIASATIITILSPQGISVLEWMIVPVFTFLFGWISINFWTVVIGFFMSLRKREPFLDIPKKAVPIAEEGRVALIMPVHNEEVPRIFMALKAMYESLDKAKALERFDIIVLSDSSNPGHLEAEELFWARLCLEVNGFGRILYRHRRFRIHKKSGNVSDFCRRWGRKYKYMITLDADSLMGGELLVRMVNMMDVRPDIGILQTAPLAMNQTSLISRLQQFSSHVYGPLFFAGLRFWQLDESGFWGHNAIVRVAPFMKYCVLPTLGGKPPFGGDIMSHDFVEAALMRRAGWGVWLAYELEDSYEELPPNLLEELERDKRWCQGNIQHLGLMFMRGIACGHRILFLNGNLFYFSSFLWFLLLVFMTINAVVLFFQKTVYFPYEHSLFPLWQVEHYALSLRLLIATAICLFTPKVLSVVLIAMSPGKAARFGGVMRLSLSVLAETIFSTCLAPLRMIFHTWYVMLNLIGQKLVWGSQARRFKKTSFLEAFRAHIVGSVVAVVWAMIAYAVSKTLFYWLAAIILPLMFAVPISVFFSYPALGLFFKRAGLFLTPVEVAPSDVLVRFQILFYGKKLS